MRLWRLSAARYAPRFDGGYGLRNDGRWNRRGQAVTYCASVPSLCVLEKLVHVEDLTLLPDDLMLVQYRVPEDIAVVCLEPGKPLAEDWRANPAYARALGADWVDANAAPLLRVPSVACPSSETGDRNFMINHAHPDAARIELVAVEPFHLDPRLAAR
ncbi:MAG: RES family NAD+ phosphorylase [Alphaproteobacteria bacterium]